MTVALLIICHNRLGEALLDAALHALPGNPLPTRVIGVDHDSDPDKVLRQASQCIEELDQGPGVLVLTDLFGSTPSNIACKLHKSHRVAVISGISLPMLIRTLNYPRLTLDELAEKAISGGRDGVVHCSKEVCDHD